MTSTISNAVAQVDAGQQMIAQYRDDFALVLPSHVKPDTFVRLAQGVLRRNPDLAAAARKNPGSFLGALLECARLGHEPGTDQYALTHFRRNNPPEGEPDVEIVGIEQYQGEIERIYRAGATASVKCEIVRKEDHFKWSPTTMTYPEHEYDALADDASRGPLVGVYAFAILTTGAISQVVVMGKGEVMKHKAVAKSKKFWDGPWEPSMWKKTSIHELEKWIPTSAEYRREQLRASAQAHEAITRGGVTLQAVPPGVNGDTGEITEAELVPEADDAYVPTLEEQAAIVAGERAEAEQAREKP